MTFPPFDWSTALAVALFILGVLASWLISRAFYRRALEVGRLSWISESSSAGYVDKTSLGNLELSLDGRVLKAPYFARVVIWNGGNKTITSTDVSVTDPLVLEIVDAEILRHSLASQTRRAVAARIERIGEGKSALYFDFLDPGDGFAVEVLLDGKTPRWSIELHGTIRGLSEGVRKESRSTRGVSIKGLLAFATSAVVLLCMGAALLLDVFWRWTFDFVAASEVAGGVLFVISGLGIGAAGAGMLWDSGFQRQGVPRPTLSREWQPAFDVLGDEYQTHRRRRLQMLRSTQLGVDDRL